MMEEKKVKVFLMRRRTCVIAGRRRLIVYDALELGTGCSENGKTTTAPGVVDLTTRVKTHVQHDILKKIIMMMNIYNVNG